MIVGAGVIGSNRRGFLPLKTKCLTLPKNSCDVLDNLVLGVCVVQHRDGVAIGHIDDLAQEGVGMGLECQAQRQSSGH